MAPEIVKNIKYDTKVDIWSFGILVYIMLTGKPPFHGKTKRRMYINYGFHCMFLTLIVNNFAKDKQEANKFKKCLSKRSKI